MNKIDELQQELVELRSKYKQNTQNIIPKGYKEKRCLIVGGNLFYTWVLLQNVPIFLPDIKE